MNPQTDAQYLLSNKTRNLWLGLLFDLIGMFSYALPILAEMSDIVWAPISAWLMTRMYKGNAGKVAGVISFVEEIVPFTDVLPTFTLMWFYTYVLNKPKE
ncbi:MAG: hypothetical protein ITG00_12080 [Flavobacterium sp.]|nr:hypothetical protein [Flavobacterium sp.]